MIGSYRRCATNLSVLCHAPPHQLRLPSRHNTKYRMQNVRVAFRIRTSKTPAWRKHGFAAFYFRTDPLQSCQTNAFSRDAFRFAMIHRRFSTNCGNFRRNSTCSWSRTRESSFFASASGAGASASGVAAQRHLVLSCVARASTLLCTTPATS